PLKLTVPAPLSVLGRESVSPVTDRSVLPVGLLTVSEMETAMPTAYVPPPGLTLSMRVGGLPLVGAPGAVVDRDTEGRRFGKDGFGKTGDVARGRPAVTRRAPFGGGSTRLAVCPLAIGARYVASSLAIGD